MSSTRATIKGYFIITNYLMAVIFMVVVLIQDEPNIWTYNKDCFLGIDAQIQMSFPCTLMTWMMGSDWIFTNYFPEAYQNWHYQYWMVGNVIFIPTVIAILAHLLIWNYIFSDPEDDGY